MRKVDRRRARQGRGALNVVVGVNDDLYDPARHDLLTAASCTTNCLAPVVKVIHEGIGIQHGSITTLHDITNTQTIVDAPHKDLRRARAASLSLIPTTTGSATAIGLIFPELQGKLNGLAVRVPLLNASLTDCVFEVARPTTRRGGQRAARRPPPRVRSTGILGYEERPLVSVDFKDDPRSAIVDALSTMVIDGTQVKILAWYDNEWGYVNRLVELAARSRCASTRGAAVASTAARAGGDLRNYALVTGAYWADTLTDGAIRMLVLFYFYELGYSPFEVASLFLFYEIFGDRHQPRRRLARRAPRAARRRCWWASARSSSRSACSRSLPECLARRALRDGRPGAVGHRQGPHEDELQERHQARRARGRAGALFRWVAILTGSKNALKGVGFFLGGLLLTARRLPDRAADARWRWSAARSLVVARC